jgi:hypothetical protein
MVDILLSFSFESLQLVNIRGDNILKHLNEKGDNISLKGEIRQLMGITYTR